MHTLNYIACLSKLIVINFSTHESHYFHSDIHQFWVWRVDPPAGVYDLGRGWGQPEVKGHLKCGEQTTQDICPHGHQVGGQGCRGRHRGQLSKVTLLLNCKTLHSSVRLSGVTINENIFSNKLITMILSLFDKSKSNNYFEFSTVLYSPQRKPGWHPQPCSVGPKCSRWHPGQHIHYNKVWKIKEINILHLRTYKMRGFISQPMVHGPLPFELIPQ